MAISGNSERISRATSSPSQVWVGGMRMSAITTSGTVSRTASLSVAASSAWATTSWPAAVSRLTMPSRSKRVVVCHHHASALPSSGETTSWSVRSHRAGTPAMKPEARDDIAWLADEQAALRRVATLVAGAPDPLTVFDMVTREASQLLDLPILTLMRFEPDGTATVMAAASDSPFPVGANIVLDGPSVHRHDPRDGPAGAHRLVRRIARRRRGTVAIGGRASRLRRADRRRRQGLGRDGGRADGRRRGRRCRGATGELHRADRNRDLERAGAR